MGRSTPIHVGVIGLGVIGSRLLQEFRSHPEIRIQAVCDTSAFLAEQVAKELNGIAWYTDYKKLIKDESIDLVYVAVPPKFHHPIALAVLEAGKHILCEKPLANSLEEAIDLAEAAQKAGVVHAINFGVFYGASFRELAQRVQEGYVGDVRRIELHTHFHQWPREWQQTPWIGGREQGGFVREVFPHYIQMIQRLFGKLVNIQAQLEWPADPEACETGIIGRMELEDGTPVLVNGLSNIGMKEHISFTIYGTKGTCSLVNWRTLKCAPFGESLEEAATTAAIIPDTIVTHLVRAIDGQEADLIDFEEGLDIQKVLEQLLQS
ncbi:Gfo/Idh/MocA family protein [Paenibacillus sedimenti]|uniref:Gfo/Idh/MocA family oxidoreductase n=1 Tax=Paenibacillus sedimenti TaxID=2770274 RepID=A0A926QMW2_9BACL|nr:Gfo/Idh/MocA family oxidoreductase [Paenibacillus sedimenti]MBD0384343.1 Gfo/Idh/MocA family oxidoreductase [Paenibacillus sedimenti]